MQQATQQHYTGRAVPTVTHSSQIKDLPWAGNFHSDSHLFAAVHNYADAPGRDREEVRAAYFELGVHAMGIDDPIDDATLDVLIAEAAERNS